MGVKGHGARGVRMGRGAEEVWEWGSEGRSQGPVHKFLKEMRFIWDAPF